MSGCHCWFLHIRLQRNSAVWRNSTGKDSFEVSWLSFHHNVCYTRHLSILDFWFCSNYFLRIFCYKVFWPLIFSICVCWPLWCWFETISLRVNTYTKLFIYELSPVLILWRYWRKFTIVIKFTSILFVNFVAVVCLY